MDEALESWIDAHPYLRPIAAFGAAVEARARDLGNALPVPRWNAYADDHAQGVPLLRSDAANVDVRDEAATALGALVERLGDGAVPEGLRAQCAAVRLQLHANPIARARAVRWLLADADAVAPPNAGLLWFLGWTALARVLGPLVREYATWRDEERWGRPYCPTCGAPPAMAQLLERGAAHERHLRCGLCRTVWRWRRLGCPFCEAADPEALKVLELEDEPRLRIDLCEGCKGYVKTYVGEGEEELFLADWTTLHLDVLARDRRYQRKGVSLYEL